MSCRASSSPFFHLFFRCPSICVSLLLRMLGATGGGSVGRHATAAAAEENATIATRREVLSPKEEKGRNCSMERSGPKKKEGRKEGMSSWHAHVIGDTDEMLTL